MTHTLKILPQYYEDVLTGKKNFELRKNDRYYHVGDTLYLRAFENGEFLNKPMLEVKIKYILKDCPQYGLMNGYVILGLE